VCRGAGLDATTQNVAEMAAGTFDLVCMNDVFEHICDPPGFLGSCRKVLAKGGFIAMGTPNGEGFDFKILKEETGNITPPEHLNYFNPVSIEVLLQRCGFEPLLTETPGKLDVEMVSERRSRGYPLREKNEYLDYLLGRGEVVLERFQRFLSENRLSSHMLVIARKRGD
jgi:SAM-dependent methyltransferase